MDLIFTKEYEIMDLYVDRFGRLKPSMMLSLVQETAGAHCRQLGFDRENLEKKRLFWAVLRNKVTVTRLPRERDKILVKTWPMPTTRVAYPRFVAAYDQEGRELFSSISLWVLMDMDTRAMVLPGKSGVEVPGVLQGCEPAAPASLNPRDLEQEALHTVSFSELDQNGHVNNTRYLDWVMDLLPTGQHQQLQLKEFTVCYLAELRDREQLAIGWSMTEEGVLLADGHRKTTNVPTGKERIFTAKLQF